MKKNKVQIPKGRVFPPVSQEEYEKEMSFRNVMYAKADALGIHTVFDEDTVFISDDMKKQYEKDSSYALSLLLGGKDVPKDVQERLLKVKRLREQAKRKSQEI